MPECGALVTRRKLVYSSQSPAFVEEPSKAGGGLEEVLAPYSINVFDIELK
jgi:hypothetical protein